MSKRFFFRLLLGSHRVFSQARSHPDSPPVSNIYLSPNRFTPSISQLPSPVSLGFCHLLSASQSQVCRSLFLLILPSLQEFPPISMMSPPLFGPLLIMVARLLSTSSIRSTSTPCSILRIFSPCPFSVPPSDLPFRPSEWLADHSTESKDQSLPLCPFPSGQFTPPPDLSS